MWCQYNGRITRWKWVMFFLFWLHRWSLLRVFFTYYSNRRKMIQIRYHLLCVCFFSKTVWQCVCPVCDHPCSIRTWWSVDGIVPHRKVEKINCENIKSRPCRTAETTILCNEALYFTITCSIYYVASTLSQIQRPYFWPRILVPNMFSICFLFCSMDGCT